MTDADIANRRLACQGIAGDAGFDACAVVGRLAAVQAQDYGAAKWAIGLRTPALTDAAIEQAFAEGAILRTHLLRPTWHFVLPADIRWLLALTAPRVNAALAYNNRRFGLDDAIFARSSAVITGALAGGKQLTRTELAMALERDGIATDGLRLVHLLMRAELDGIVCSGARRGKHFTYALIEERVPPVPALSRDEALALLARRYFSSRGPATLQDYAWWSGLAAADARASLALIRSELDQALVDGKEYWFGEPPSLPTSPGPTAYLLPNYDEYTVSYADRSAIFDAPLMQALGPRAGSLLNYVIVIGGRVAGTWKRTVGKGAVAVTLRPFAPLSTAETGAVATAAQRFGAFLGLPVVLAWQ